jgi:hypothetical protein
MTGTPRALSATRMARADRPEHDGLLQPGFPARRVLVEIAEKAEIIGVEGVDALRPVDQRIGRPDGPGQRLQRRRGAERGFLVRQSDVAADELAGPEPREEGVELRRRHIDRLIAAVDAVGFQPVPMDQRRARMGDGVTDDESAFHVNPKPPRGLVPFVLDSTRSFESALQAQATPPAEIPCPGVDGATIHRVVVRHVPPAVRNPGARGPAGPRPGFPTLGGFGIPSLFRPEVNKDLTPESGITGFQPTVAIHSLSPAGVTGASWLTSR